MALRLEGNPALSHGDLRDLLEQGERDLRGLGIGRTTRVMTALPDGPLAACVLLTIIRSAIGVPVNPDLRESEFAALIPELGATVLVAHGPWAEEARRAAAGAGLPVVEVEWDGRDRLRWVPRGGMIARRSGDRAAVPDDLALVLLTSGSSARPKRVPLTHRHLALSARRMARSIGLTAGDCCLNLMPMFHVGAVVDLLLAPLSAGGSVLRPDSMSPEAFFRAVHTGLPTWFQGVPTLLHELAVQALRDPSRLPRPSPLRLVRSVSSPLPPEWLGEIQSALGTPLVEIYGMTETAGVITSNPWPPERPVRLGSVGRPVEVEVKVVPLDGGDARVGQRGEVQVRGAGVMSGYENPDGGESGLTGDGWLRTGDEGYFDEDGFLFLTGRIGEQINRGGEKISPREIDEVLASHPGVSEAAAFGVSHPQLGQEVAAAVVLVPGCLVSAGSLRALVSSRLAHFKVPKAYYAVDTLPRGPGGKLRRRLLPDLISGRAPMEAGEGEDSGPPQSETERRVASRWEAELGVSPVERGSNFFELGGDSLAAASVIVGLEKALGISIRPAALFDHPTLAAFAAHLDRRDGEEGSRPELASGGLNPDYHRRLLAALSVWPGRRRDDASLLVELRPGAAGTPVFWCGQGSGEFTRFARALPEEHPLFGTRSLFLFEGKKRPDEAALAELLAREIEERREGRDVVVGGFCAGGRIAFDAARRLRSWGSPVKMVFLHEAFPLEPIDVPVAMGFTESYGLSPFRRFSRPEMAMAKRFPAGWKLWRLNRLHEEVYGAESLAEEMPKWCALWRDSSGFERRQGMVEVNPRAYRARFSAWRWTRITGPGREGHARVRVTNASHHVWLPGTISGLHLGHRWVDAGGKTCGDPGPSVPLPVEVPPGGAVTLTAPFRAPHEPGRHLLELDLVDEGFMWFSEKASRHPSASLRLPIRVLRFPGSGLLKSPFPSPR